MIASTSLARSRSRSQPASNPLSPIKAKQLTPTRTLSDDELRALWRGAQQDKGSFGAFVRFTLLAATRRSESAWLHRRELSDNGATWTIPGLRYKNGKDVIIPLSKAAQDIIASMPARGDFVFGVDGTRPLASFADRKKKLDAVSGVENYTLHDLRRTSRTLLCRAGIAADVAEMCLGHALSGVRGTYDRHAYENEKRYASWPQPG
jgi:integrase